MRDDETSEEEIFCNAVAGEFLVPKDDLNKNINLNNLLANESITKLSHMYGVSSHVILRRLYDTNNINRHDYNNIINNFEEISSSEGSGGNYFNNIIKYNGESYCAIVLEAYESGIINSGDFSKLTNLKKKFIPNLQNRIYGAEQ